jgi:GT2 family glycosyltransferase
MNRISSMPASTERNSRMEGRRSEVAQLGLGDVNERSGPHAVGAFDLDTSMPSWRTPDDERRSMGRALVLVRDRGWPVGVEVVELEQGELVSTWRPRIAAVPSTDVRERGVAASITVVICTRDRPGLLAQSLPRFRALCRPGDQLVVVDNAPSDAATARLVEGFDDVEYVVEPVAGLARARNRGLSVATGTYVVFTDDDVDPDPSWLQVIAATFEANPGAVMVSGSVLPASLTTPAELRFQEFGGYVPDFTEARLHMSLDPMPSVLFPFHPKLLGTGANMTFRTEALRALGGFDVCLGAGTPARGGEDIDIAVRVLLAGHLLVRQPAAVLWHPSHTTDAMLTSQIRGYGVGLAAAFTKFGTRRSTAGAVLRRVPAGLKMMLSADSAKNAGRSDSFPRELRRAELLGVMSGPLAYRRSVRAQRALEHRDRP